MREIKARITIEYAMENNKYRKDRTEVGKLIFATKTRLRIQRKKELLEFQKALEQTLLEKHKKDLEELNKSEDPKDQTENNKDPTEKEPNE